jgi:signal transduction histidine kinase/HAMP domain-containing protein
MPWPLQFLPKSIGGRMLGAFAAMALLICALGIYGSIMLSRSGRVVADTYDRPLMAINFARAASLDFMRMNKELLREKLLPDARAQLEANIDALEKEFYADLAVAEERSLSSKEIRVAEQIRELAVQWDRARRSPDATRGTTADKPSEDIIRHFDTLIELTADDAFVERRKAISAIARYKYAVMGESVAAFLIAAALIWRLRRQIVLPLSAAARVADRIARGELQTAIPAGGEDETGALLRSMTVMQDNIRAMVHREMAEKHSAQRRLVDALESASEGMLLVDATGRVVVANSRMATLFPAIAADRLSGGTVADFVRLARAQIAADADAAAIEHGGEIRLADGRWIRISRSATQEGGFFLLLSDFTDIKTREQHYKDAKLQAEAASRAKSRFLANMGHELRTPLNAIIGFSEIIAGQAFGPQAGDKYVAYAANILDSGRHLLGVINAVLDLARIETGNLTLSLEPIDLHEILANCARLMRERCAEAGLAFDLQIGEAPLPVVGDAPKLRQTFLNLLANAAKFTEAGGSAGLRAGVADGLVRVEIFDTGIGMTPEEIALALTPFEQVDAKLARRYEGAGLGLPLAKALVELHGGTIAIASEKGKGTKVTVTLKRAAEKQRTLRLVANS